MVPFCCDVLTEVWYMQRSRLHFIGTWRNRYRKRFPISSTGFNHEISNINASDISGKSVVIHVDMVSHTYKDVGYKLLLSTNFLLILILDKYVNFILLIRFENESCFTPISDFV